MTPDWRRLKRYTSARVALGRAGDGLPTRAYLEFELALAEARDAVLETLDVARLEMDAVVVHSAARDRHEYLLRPDLGRRLDDDSRAKLAGMKGASELAVVVADGLSALAVQRHAGPVLAAFRSRYEGAGPVIVAEQARVALGDDIAETLGARSVAVLIGERPGLSSPDSLGIYFTYAPRVGSTDAERNCISNVRGGGLGYDAAAEELVWLVKAARTAGLSGVRLKQLGAPASSPRIP